MKEKFPVGWFEAPFGDFRQNPLFKAVGPQCSSWALPVYLEPSQKEFEDAKTKAWNTATMRASQICDAIKPLGGRPWTEAQLACFNALSEASYAIRESRINPGDCLTYEANDFKENYKAVGYISASGEYKKGCPSIGEADGWVVLYVKI